MIGRCLARSAGIAGALALALVPPAAQAAAAVCPDPATVQAARIVEFQTMMMGVSVRCKHVGVAISDHLDQMTSTRRTMLTGANDRVAMFLRSLGSTPKPTVASLTGAPAGAQPPVATPAAKAPPAKAGTRQGAAATARAPGRKGATAAAAPASAQLVEVSAPAPAKPGAGKPAAGKAAAGKAAGGKAPARSAAAAIAPVAKSPAAKPAKVSRRTDPFDRYLTMIGNQYGAGMTTLQRCKAFDAIVVSLADRTNSDRLMTMVSSSLVEATLLEAIVNCPAKK